MLQCYTSITIFLSTDFNILFKPKLSSNSYIYRHIEPAFFRKFHEFSRFLIKGIVSRIDCFSLVRSTNRTVRLNIGVFITFTQNNWKPTKDERKFVLFQIRHLFRCFFFLWRCSPNLGLGLPPWNSPFYFGLLDLRHSVELLGRVISPSQGLYLYTNTEKRTHTYIHKHQTSMLWVRFEPSACLRPLGYCDRPLSATNIHVIFTYTTIDFNLSLSSHPLTTQIDPIKGFKGLSLLFWLAFLLTIYICLHLELCKKFFLKIKMMIFVIMIMTTIIPILRIKFCV
jgi:hypothetical protein